MGKAKLGDSYSGFEQGPIRPPSEAKSLLIRVNRNCPWNRCTFCPVYKNARFSLRPVEHVIVDVDAVAGHVAKLRGIADSSGRIDEMAMGRHLEGLAASDRQAFFAALNWVIGGMESIFLQDANALLMKPAEMVRILSYLKKRFPQATRITSYARSHTITRIGERQLRELAAAGLNRVHIGMESASDEVLRRVKKGTTKVEHVEAGKMVIDAGMELSEYVMPGLGGRLLSEEHVRETADALNQINPHFIRLRTLAIPASTPIYKDLQAGRFEQLTDYEIAREVLLLLESLDGITSSMRSDHILNLLEEIDGSLPEDKERLLTTVKRFLDMPANERVIFQVGRRLGYLRRLDDLADSVVKSKIQEMIEQYDITPENADDFLNELKKRFI